MAGLAFLTVISSSLVAMATAAPAGPAAYSGSMTYNPYNGNLGACGRPINNGDSTVAVAPKFFTAGNPGNDPICGRTVTITYNGKSATAQVWDKCPGCGDNDLDATPDLFTRMVGSLDPGRVNVQWTGI
ncbi:RlpA-like double-psi beta-barrel-protein domain-containing protein-containing protein [Apiospora rasikravindrae]|uniref:RlpA-like double-psi beta-barrel-protein domain-containing protein-containing protein n=1 Tax=Apiospora rasikravindrae TaxID=990691 RepID=A0ABR1TZ24_9PEZI